MNVVTQNWRDVPGQREVQRFHAPLYRRWKKRFGGMHAPVSDIPGFVESLQMLHDYGYHLTDIAVMWGVTRERVRQWFERYGLERHESLASARVWDDDLELFYPVSFEEYERRYRDKRKRDRAHAALASDIALVQSLNERLGRPPTLTDFAEATYGPGRRHYPIHGVAQRWGAPRNNQHGDCTYSEALDRLYDAAGVGRPTRGDAQRYRYQPNNGD